MSEKLTEVRIDLAALAHNLDVVRARIGPGVRVMAVVKADAYGHGLVPTARHLLASGAEMLGVMDVDEAVRLREAGVKAPVCVLAGVGPADLDDVAAHALTPFIYDPALARDLDRVAGRRGRPVRAHLKIDSGMNRLGVAANKAQDFLEMARGLRNLMVTGLVTHLAEADAPESDFSREQLDRFRGAIEAARALGFQLTENSAANSAATLTLPEARFDVVRPGLALYGADPFQGAAGDFDLRPVMQLVSRVIQVKDVRAGQTISYGRTWTADRPTRLVVLPVGYAHGLSRRLSGQGFVLIRGRRAPIRGRVCMNLTVADVTEVPGVAVGDEAVLLGRQGGERLSAQDMAEMMGTISYEVFTTIGGLNPRRYFNPAGPKEKAI